jgi:hypothetical protein
VPLSGFRVRSHINSNKVWDEFLVFQGASYFRAVAKNLLYGLSPPITINGEGFGQFPNGMPFSGVSNYLQIIDTTEGWGAGHTGDACSVSIDSWSNQQIQLVANVSQNGMCTLAAQDNLRVKVWNPQTMAAAEFKLTVAAR